MPQIRQYENTGQVGGSVNTQRASGEDFGAGIGRSIQTVGAQVNKFGDILQKREDQNDISELHKNIAQAQDELGSAYQEEYQKGTLDHDAFMDKVQDTLQSVGDSVKTRVGSLRFQQLEAQTKLHFSQQSQSGQAVLAGVKAVNNFKVAADARSGAVLKNPNSFETLLTQQNQEIDDMVATKGLPAVEADKLKREAMDKLAFGAVRGIITLSPEQAEKELQDGKWDPYMGEASQYRAGVEIERAKRANLIEEERKQRLQEKAEKAVHEKTMSSYISALNTDGGSLSAKQIIDDLNSGKINSQGAEHALRLIRDDATNKKLQSDPEVLRDLYQQIILPDGDPNKLTDVNKLDAHGMIDISLSDLDRLHKVMLDRGTERGEAEAHLKKSFFEDGFNNIAKPDPVTKMPDPKGYDLYRSWEASVWDEYLKQKTGGKSTRQLLSPDSPDYIGKKYPFSAYQRSVQEVIGDTVKKLQKDSQKDIPKNPRKEGESIDAYLKRIGK